MTLSDAQVPSILAAFGLGSSGRLSDGRVASGRLGSIWRLDSEVGSWAVKQVGDVSPGELAELLEGAAFQEAALAAGVPAPAVRRTRASIRWRSGGWSPASTASTSRARSASTPGTRSRSGRRAGPSSSTWSAPVAPRSPLSSMRSSRSWSRWRRGSAVRRATTGPVIATSGPTTSGALILVQYCETDPRRAGVVRSAYAEAGGPGRVEGPADFAMPIAQLSHIVAEGCRRWLGATTADERRDNEGWVREFVDAPLTRAVIEALLATP